MAVKRQLPDISLHFVTLNSGIRVALERDQMRPEKTVAAAWNHLDAEIRRERIGSVSDLIY